MEKLVESMYCMYNEQIKMRLTNEKRQDCDDLISLNLYMTYM